MKSTTAGQADNRNNGAALMQFAVGYKGQPATPSWTQKMH
jgi:hypothetical protein